MAHRDVDPLYPGKTALRRQRTLAPPASSYIVSQPHGITNLIIVAAYMSAAALVPPLRTRVSSPTEIILVSRNDHPAAKTVLLTSS